MNFSYYRLKLSYKGTHYLGWQIQKEHGKTIQGELNNALMEICHSGEIHTLGAGRTDARVHALAQICRVKIPLNIEPINLLKGLNSLLPEDIRVLDCSLSSEDFNPISDARGKEYLYCFTAGSHTRGNPQTLDLIAHCPHDLDLEKMQQGCRLFLGERDFSNFYCQGSDVKSTVREIFEISLTRNQNLTEIPCWPSEYYLLKIVGNGFLKQMVRLIVGALWTLGRNKTSLQDLETAINDITPRRVGPTAPPQGLYLSKIFYE